MTGATLLLQLGRPLRDAAAGMAGHVRRWAPVLAKFVLVQLAVQAFGMLAGIVIVRTLAKQDYALYTIANTILPALYALANSGVTFAASAIGGRVWQDDRRLGQVLVTAFEASRALAAFAILPVLLVLVFLLHRNGASPPIIAIIAGLVLATALLQLRTAILVVVPRLKGDVRFLQRTDLAAAMLRAALIGSAALVWLDTAVALLMTTFANLFQYLATRGRVRGSIDLAVAADPAMAGEMRRVAGRQWLNEIHYLLQGQISVFLLGVFGSTASVADFGALGRIGLLFAAVGASMQSVVLPRFARCQEPRRLRQLYIQILAANVVLAAVPVIVALAVPRPFLWLLGPRYMGLPGELVLVALNAATAAVCGISGFLNAVRAWIIPGWIAVLLSITVELILMLTVGVSTLRQVLWISILSNLFLTAVFVVGAVHFGRRFAGAAMARSASPDGAM